MKYYWKASSIEMNTAVLPCPEIITKVAISLYFMLILSHFRPFLLIFKVILLIIFIDFKSFY